MMVCLGLVLISTFAVSAVSKGISRKEDPFFKNTKRGACPPPIEGVPLGLLPVLRNVDRINLNNLMQGIEPPDDCEVEGIIAGDPDKYIPNQYIKDTPASAFHNKRILDLLAKVAKKITGNPLVSTPEIKLVTDENTGKTLVSSDELPNFTTFGYNPEQLKIIKKPQIISVGILASMFTIPHLHQRDIGLSGTDENTVSVVDLDGMEFSLLVQEGGFQAATPFFIKEGFPILTKESLNTTLEILTEFNLLISAGLFELFGNLTPDFLETIQVQIIESMHSNPLNTPRGITLSIPKKSFDDLMEKLKTKSIPQILSDAYSLKISSAIEALTKAKEALTDHNQDNPYFIYFIIFHYLKYFRIKHSDKQHSISIAAIQTMLSKLEQMIDKAKQSPDTITPKNYLINRMLDKEFEAFTKKSDYLYALSHAIHLAERNLKQPITEKTEL